MGYSSVFDGALCKSTWKRKPRDLQRSYLVYTQELSEAATIRSMVSNHIHDVYLTATYSRAGMKGREEHPSCISAMPNCTPEYCKSQALFLKV